MTTEQEPLIEEFIKVLQKNPKGYVDEDVIYRMLKPLKDTNATNGIITDLEKTFRIVYRQKENLHITEFGKTFISFDIERQIKAKLEKHEDDKIELTTKQIENYSKTEFRAKWGFIIAILSAFFTLVSIVIAGWAIWEKFNSPN